MVRVGIAKELSKSLEYLGHCSGLCRMSRVTVDSATVVAITHLELRTFLASGVTTLLAFLTGNLKSYSRMARAHLDKRLPFSVRTAFAGVHGLQPE